MQTLLHEIRKCMLCHKQLPLGANPIVSAHPKSKIIIVGQAPGTKVHQTGIPWNDPSGNELRRWLEITKADFYDETKIALVPMGFCYPGKGKSGDLPPRAECAPQWHEKLMQAMPEINLVLLIGQYAQRYYLKNTMQKTLTETVKNYQNYLPRYMPLPHPSPRNRIWMKKNSWFEKDIIPVLRSRIRDALCS